MSKNSIFVSLWILLYVFSSFPKSSGINQEGSSLLSWLSTFNSSSSSSLFFSSWNSADQNPCSWAYIRCSNGGFVQEIRITSMHLPTSFPEEVTSFSYITNIVISDTNLTGEIPVSISNLSESLVVLDLGFNSLTGKIPSEIGKLKKLQSLSLNSNFLSGKLPPELGNCSSLKRLELFDNQLSGKIPPEVGKLNVLETFRAGGNSGMIGGLPEDISNCKQLEYLGLSDTKISGNIPRSFGELKNLKTLAIYTAELSGSIPREIGNCSNLENLFIYQNQLSGEIPQEIGFLKKLTRLLLWQNNLERQIPESIGNCTSLKVIDFSENLFSGNLPLQMANLAVLEELLLSENNFSGQIPKFIGNLLNLKQIELDNNRFQGEIPATTGRLKDLTLFFAWQNLLMGNIPDEIANCTKLQSLDLSHNSLSGFVPNSLFNLKNLSQFLLINNRLSGEIPSEIGNCTSLVRVRLSSNSFSGHIPATVGKLSNLIFLELSENQLSGEIPMEIGNCKELELLDLHQNKLIGKIPESFQYLTELNVLDLSMNSIEGNIPRVIGKLVFLNKLMINRNNITGSIPGTLWFCKDLQLLDLSSNQLTGFIPDELGFLEEMDILMNLSKNSLTGPIPDSFVNLKKLANLDLSQNKLTGNLKVLSNLVNLASLNVSFNNFSGVLPNTNFFQHLPPESFLGNQGLCSENSNKCPPDHPKRNTRRNIVVYSLVSAGIAATVAMAVFLWLLRSQGSEFISKREEEWEFTSFQKLGFTLNDIITGLSDSNIIGQGCSGVVYRIETSSKQVIAVKKLSLINKSQNTSLDWFSAEINILGSIRHRNIVRLLGHCSNRRTKLLFFDYISNGSLAGLLHEKTTFLDWDVRFGILSGVAHGLAYLHHDCVPPIIHRDIKTNNILIGSKFEAYLADFGLAKLVDDEAKCLKPSNAVAGSYGYIAPEYGYSTKISEKSDVYSFGVVLMEILTRKQPVDTRIPEDSHIVKWINDELRETRGDFTSILDEQLMRSSGTKIQEMRQVLGVASLCVNSKPEERPSMKDVVAMLAEIRNHTGDECQDEKVDSDSVTECSSFSRLSEQPLITSPV